MRDLAWCLILGLTTGGMDRWNVLRRLHRPHRCGWVKLAPPAAAMIKGFVPVAAVSLAAPGPTLPFVTAVGVVAAHLAGAGWWSVGLLWLLLGASFGLRLWGLGIVLATVACAVSRFRDRRPAAQAYLPPHRAAGAAAAAAVFAAAVVLGTLSGPPRLTTPRYREDIHYIWTAFALAASLLCLGHGLIQRQRAGLRRVRRYATILLAAFLLVSANHVTLSRAGFTHPGACEQIVRGPPCSQAVALTFDDGPDPLWTPEVLRILREAGIQATFFMVGSKVRAHPELARQVVAEGHIIGNHSYTHRDLTTLGRSRLIFEIDETQKAIEEICAITPELFRPPRGATSPMLIDLLAERGLTLALWSVSSTDWLQLSPGGIVAALRRHVRPGVIMLFHDSGDYLGSSGADRRGTLRALPRVIDLVKIQGLGFATVDEMLARGREAGWHMGIMPHLAPSPHYENDEDWAAAGMGPN